ncbi:MAG: HAMP domain-containing histidine kinase [Chloroflexi bacterium]|nr:HAMP domain-containing histidine kinase [Chloroflexota bacterium]
MTIVPLIIIFLLLIIMVFGYRHLTERHKVQIEAIRAQHVLEMKQFLERFDHELKNPLTAMRFALINVDDDQGYEAAINSIREQTLRIGALLQNLRKLAEFSTVSIEQIPVNVDALLHEAVALAHEHQPQRKISIRNHATMHIKGDKYLLLLAIYNLLDNALKYSDNGIEVTAWNEYQSVEINVKDNGAGIPQAELSHVWEELYRGTDVRHVQGSGLGLALVKAIVERHGGQVDIDSAPHDGTTVTLTLPAVAA